MGERRALVVMTRVPEPGKTKTRMMPDLTPSQCAEFHACMLRDISETCVAVAKRGVEVFVAFAPEGAREEVGAYFDVEAGYFPQRGATLGERLGNAIGEVLSRGCSRVAVIGADSPEVGSGTLSARLTRSIAVTWRWGRLMTAATISSPCPRCIPRRSRSTPLAMRAFSPRRCPASSARG